MNPLPAGIRLILSRWLKKRMVIKLFLHIGVNIKLIYVLDIYVEVVNNIAYGTKKAKHICSYT